MFFFVCRSIELVYLHFPAVTLVITCGSSHHGQVLSNDESVHFFIMALLKYIVTLWNLNNADCKAVVRAGGSGPASQAMAGPLFGQHHE